MMMNFERQTLKSKNHIYDNEQLKHNLLNSVQQYFSQFALTTVRLQRPIDTLFDTTGDFYAHYSGVILDTIYLEDDTIIIEAFRPEQNKCGLKSIPHYLNNDYIKAIEQIKKQLDDIGINNFSIDKEGKISLKASARINDVFACVNVKLQPYIKGVF